MPRKVYHPDMGETVYQFMKTGNSISATAEMLGIHRDTLYEWEDKHPEFTDYFMRAKQASCVHWEKILEAMTLDNKVNSAQYKAIELILANRFRDLYSKNAGKQEIEITHKDALTPEEIDKRLHELLTDS